MKTLMMSMRIMVMMMMVMMMMIVMIIKMMMMNMIMVHANDQNTHFDFVQGSNNYHESNSMKMAQKSLSL